MDDEGEEQQYCLRWNNFQANITSQFEALRDDEDFTDVSIVCEGRSIKAHRVVLSACSPLFKEMFKNNPCSHPIIFMRDVDARSVSSLLEFMYAGEVNVAQAHLSNFLRTAESLKIRGLTDPHTDALPKKQNLSKCTSTTNSEVALPMSVDRQPNTQPCKQITQSTRQETDRQTRLKQTNTEPIDPENNNETLVNISHNNNNTIIELEEVPEEDITMKQMKIELPEFSEYFSDVEEDHEGHVAEITALTEVEQLETLEIPLSSGNNYKTHSEHGFGVDTIGVARGRSQSQSSRTCEDCGRTYSNLSNLRQHMRLVHFPTHPACDICQRRFKTDLYLKRHMHNSHDVFAIHAYGPRRPFCDVSLTKLSSHTSRLY
ncbi:protein abrupt-like isoform X2 [Atheta coriaria]|uniref:protein abrupt-like isoform X2 n=1 Tax=Dalotia coriaria TaxID=877792 RepID=UPI0031F42A89